MDIHIPTYTYTYIRVRGFPLRDILSLGALVSGVWEYAKSCWRVVVVVAAAVVVVGVITQSVTHVGNWVFTQSVTHVGNWFHTKDAIIHLYS